MNRQQRRAQKKGSTAAPMSPDLRDWKGWRLALCKYHHEILEAQPEFVSEVLTRALYRAYGMRDYSQLENYAFAFEPASDGVTKITNMDSDPEGRQRVEDVVVGVFAVLEIIHDGYTVTLIEKGGDA